MDGGWYAWRAQQGQAHVPETALVPVVLCRPRVDHDFLGLDQPIVGFGRIDAVALVIVNIVCRAASQTHDEPAFADVVDE